ncbi:MAG: hypothetical protein AAF560_05710 [Acidobacteriota bacterium]
MRFVLLFLVASLLAANGPVGAEIPDFIEADRPGPDGLLWFSEDYAKESDGSLAWSLFHPWDQEGLQRTLESNEAKYRLETSKKRSPFEEVDKCQVSRGWVDEDHNPGGSIEVLVENATHIVHGVVVAGKQGFMAGRPGSIFEVAHKTVLKAPEGYSPPENHLVFMGIARIATDKGILCSTSFRPDNPPTLGARLMLFLFEDSFGEGTALLLPPRKSVFYQNSGESMSVPLGFSRPKELGLEIDQLAEIVAKHLEVARGEGR